MLLPRTMAVTNVTVLDSVSSTNDVLAARASAADSFEAVLTTTQTSGRGRLGREWVAPPGTSLALSVLVRPVGRGGAPVNFGQWGWLPLLAGLAMSTTVASLLPDAEVRLKWPNDVLVGGKKISGILSELVDDASGVIIGVGLNLSIAKADLPTPTSTSLALEGATLSGDALVDAACSTWLTSLRSLVNAFQAADGDVERTGLRAATERGCGSVGSRVRVELPGVPDLVGDAVSIDSVGRLIVRTADAVLHPISAGDITHLRHEMGSGGAP